MLICWVQKHRFRLWNPIILQPERSRLRFTGTRVRGHSFFSIIIFNEPGTVRLQPVLHEAPLAAEMGIVLAHEQHNFVIIRYISTKLYVKVCTYLLFNSYLKFYAEICTHCWNIKKVTWVTFFVHRVEASGKATDCRRAKLRRQILRIAMAPRAKIVQGFSVVWRCYKQNQSRRTAWVVGQCTERTNKLCGDGMKLRGQDAQ